MYDVRLCGLIYLRLGGTGGLGHIVFDQKCVGADVLMRAHRSCAPQEGRVASKYLHYAKQTITW